MIRMNGAWTSVGLAILISLAGISGAIAQQAEPQAPAKEPGTAPAVVEEPVYAVVNGTAILRKDFHAALTNHLRQKLYHGQGTPERLEAYRKEVTDTLVDRVLLLEEAGRRGLAPDAESIAKTIAEYDARYAGRPTWLQTRESVLPGLKKELSERNLLEQLEKAVRNLPEASEDDVRKFYAARKELFTEPEKMRIHVILLKVDPSSTRAVWDAALEEGRGIVKRLRAGASFEDEARVKSNDPSAENGGDMGYLHMGVVPEALQARIKEYQPGEIPDPLEVLQGIGIFRLDERVPAQLRAYDDVKTRARELLKRDTADKAWADLRERLKAAATIQIDEVRFVVAAPTANQAAGAVLPQPKADMAGAASSSPQQGSGQPK